MSSTKIYWANGLLKRSVDFQEGLRTGLDQMWNEEGILVDEGLYEQGIPVGVHRRWNALGELIEETHHTLPSREKSLALFMERYPMLALLFPRWTPSETPFESIKHFDPGKSEVIYIYGLGVGAPYFQMKSWLHEKGDRKLVFLEDDEGHFAYFLQSPHSAALLSDPQVHFELIGKDKKELQTIAEKFPMRRVEMAALPSKDKNRFRSLKLALLRKTTLSHALYQDRLHGDHLFQNFAQNLRHLPSSFYANGLKGAFQGIPAIICGAGPSLQSAIPLLKTLSGRALIIAGGSTLAALSSQGVPIHFGIAVDPNWEEVRRMKNSFAFDTPLLYSTRVHPGIFQTCSGPFGYMRSGIGGVLELWMEEALGLQDPLIGKHLSQESISVTTVCMAWAVFLGCSAILLSGVDLAYTNQKHYAAGVKLGEEIPLPLFDVEKCAADRILWRRDRLRQPIQTATRWVMESASLADFAKKHRKNVRFINTTEGGLPIRGIPYLSLPEAADLYLTNVYPLESQIKEWMAKSPMPQNSQETIVNKMKELRESLARVIDCLEVLALKKKGSLALAELDLEEEMATDFLFYDIFEMLYRVRPSFVNFGGSQSGSDLSDPEEANIASILATRDRSKMGCSDGPKNSQNLGGRGIEKGKKNLPPQEKWERFLDIARKYYF